MIEMSGIEQTFWEFERLFWLFVMFIGAVFAIKYIFEIASDIRQDRRIKKLMKNWEKEK